MRHAALASSFRRPGSFRRLAATLALSVVGTLGLAGHAQAGITTFDQGTQGWVAPIDPNYNDYAQIVPTGGNPGANYTISQYGAFFFDVHNSTNPDVVGNYAAKGGPIRLGLDVKVNSIVSSTGDQGIVPIAVSLFNLQIPGADSTTGVTYVLGTLSQAEAGWRRFEVIIDDPTSMLLPTGWIGSGDLDADKVPLLPAGVTFMDVLSSVDLVQFSSSIPGFYNLPYNFELAFDNLTVEFLGTNAVAEPSAMTLLFAGIAGLCFLSRRRRESTGGHAFAAC